MVKEKESYKNETKNNNAAKRIPMSEEFEEILEDELDLNNFYLNVRKDYEQLNGGYIMENRQGNALQSQFKSGPTINEMFDVLTHPEEYVCVQDIAYLAKDTNPLCSAYSHWKILFQKDDKCTAEFAIFNMVETDYLHLREKWLKDNPKTNADDNTPKVFFFEGESTLDDLKGYRIEGLKLPVEIRKLIILSKSMFSVFSDHLQNEYSFIRENKDTVYRQDKKIWDCLLVSATDGNEGVLVAAEGHNHAKYVAYIPDYSKFDLSAIPQEYRDPTFEIADIKALILSTQSNLSIADTQHLICSIGEIIDENILEPDRNDECYLFNDIEMHFAGFVGDEAGVTDCNGTPLHIGDVTEISESTSSHLVPRVVYQHADGSVFPSQNYINVNRVRKVADSTCSIMVAKTQCIEVCSCISDYRKSRSMCERMRQTKEKIHSFDKSQ